jgi:DNA mismatch endonuclease (patch repair protein)
MADVFSSEKRSEVMQCIKSKDTKPEVRLRKALHKLGFRFRLHDKRLPGKPDILLPRFKTIIQVRGCFWHGHNCIDGHLPKSNEEYWTSKLKANKERDERNSSLLSEMGWNEIVVWECRCMSSESLAEELDRICKSLIDWNNNVTN